MSQEFSTPPESGPSETYSWLQSWTRALTRPSVATFEALVRDPKASSRRAFTWVFIAGLISYSFTAFVQLAFTGASGSAVSAGILGESILIFLCLLPVTGVGVVVELLMIAGITQFIARAISGSGTFSQLVYAIATISAPYSLVSGLLVSIPYLNWLVLPLSLYFILLSVIATRAVHQFSWGKAVASNISWLILMLASGACIFIFFLYVMSGGIGNIF